MRSDKDRLLDIVEGIGHIEKYSVSGRAEFEKSELVQVYEIWNALEKDIPALKGLLTKALATFP